MLEPWLMGNEVITPKNFFEENSPYYEYGAFIGIDEYIDLYKANQFDCGNLNSSWNATREYIEKALEVIGRDKDDEDYELDNEEKYMILNSIGKPPLCSYNIYFITIYNETEEKVVYIGKTDSRKSRFSNGHRASLKLHNPIYNNYNKRVYFATVMFLDKDKEYLPLEYITPLDEAKKILGYTESILIRYFQPELNTQMVNNDEIAIKTVFHIQNFTNTVPFLNDIFISI
ncbi:MAG: hypothetical protein SPH93_10310 [Clostridium sp.]|uniref:hypothetical protein n=1 Tax=Clostridium sp. TaxID=1506 RepID=UPI002A913D75|nr:hypothetical protein [Clostridium sp.]MDY6228039.1 hypothetical protein [Clostridium sp.]